MMSVSTALVLLSVLLPSKGWYAPGQPLTVQVKADTAITLVLNDFSGLAQQPAKSAEPATVVGDGGKISVDTTVDLRPIFPALANPGTYVLYAVPKDKNLKQFVGTPLVIKVREDKRRGSSPGPQVVRVEPLCYAMMETDKGALKMVFYYDVAPNTVDNFLSLAGEKYFDGLNFHRIVPGFVIQGGDPRGDGTGGPGYQIDAEFNDRPHTEGVLSMARSMDPNSAGSQFFICLDYKRTVSLDHQYTAFGKVVAGMDVVKQIAAVPLADQATGRPEVPPVIKQVTVKPVTASDNPYAEMMQPAGAATP